LSEEIQIKLRDNTFITRGYRSKMMLHCKEGNQLHKKREIFHNVRQPDASILDVQRILTQQLAPRDTVCYADEFIKVY